ncbi:MAG: Sarcosine oxidase, gamma subunit family [Pseudomonadota bacterium]
MADDGSGISRRPMQAAFSVNASWRPSFWTEVAARLAACAGGAGARCLSLGAGEWLLVAPLDREAALAQALEACLSDCDADLHCVSDAWSAWGIGGSVPAARALLAHGADISWPAPDAEPDDFIWRGALGPYAVLIWQRSSDQALEVWVERSYCESLGFWLSRREGLTAGSSGGGMASREAASRGLVSRGKAAGA